MRQVNLQPLSGTISGTIEVPGDKSISHRAVMFGSMADGETKITNFLDGEDCIRTIEAFRALGVSILQEGTTVTIDSQGIHSFKEPKIPLYFGNSGTTARLMIGLLVGLPFVTIIYGDPYLTERPMDRVIDPANQMGAQIDGRQGGRLLPLSIKGGKLTGMYYKLPVKSAQVKSAVLLAGLLAEGNTTVLEETKTRDHTENMLAAFGANITVKDNEITINSEKKLQATDVVVPGDISSAAFLMVAAAIVPNSKLTLNNVGLNETRTGIIDVLKNMGSNISIANEREISGEKSGDVTITYAPLKSTTISGNLIPRLIDEIPVIALLASQAEGTTIIKDAKELRVKETDRIDAVVDVLGSLGADIQPTEDGMIVVGKTPLTGGEIASYNDHRIAMMGSVASLIASGEVILDDDASIAISYPNFFKDLQQISR